MGCGAHKKAASQQKAEAEEIKRTDKYPDNAKSDGILITTVSQEIKVDPSLFIKKNDKQVNDNYKIDGKIGEGSNGYIRKATLLSTGEQRAIKSIEKSMISKNPADKLKFFNEVEVLKKIDHPNILKVYEYYEDSTYFHMVTEYISGGQLFDKILQTNDLSEPTVVNLMRQIFSAIAYCHEHKIIHGDLQPENIMLDISSLKIIDFGTSSLIGTSHYDLDYSNALFTAPEVLSGKGYNEKCDVWSCGVILYMLLSGKPPFFGKDQKIIEQRVVIGDYSLKSAEWKNVSESAKDLVKHTLEYLPEKRISAKEALEHKWMTEITSGVASKSQVDISALSNLQSFRQGQKFQQAVLTFIGSQIVSKESQAKMSENFRKIDTNGDGKISKDELLAVYLKTKNLEEANNEVAVIMDKVDTNNSGFIDYSEFMIACLEHEDIVNDHNLKIAFRAFDTDNSGKINIGELTELFEIGVKKQSYLTEILKGIDNNGDGEIDFAEFTQMMVRTLTARGVISN